MPPAVTSSTPLPPTAQHQILARLAAAETTTEAPELEKAASEADVLDLSLGRHSATDALFTCIFRRLLFFMLKRLEVPSLGDFIFTQVHDALAQVQLQVMVQGRTVMVDVPATATTMHLVGVVAARTGLPFEAFSLYFGGHPLRGCLQDCDVRRGSVVELKLRGRGGVHGQLSSSRSPPSITNAQLPMSSLLNGSTALDLSGKSLGRIEMGIAAQLLRSNSSLQLLNLSDNLMSRQPMEALTEALLQGRPPLVDVSMGNLGIRSGGQIHRFIKVRRLLDQC